MIEHSDLTTKVYQWLKARILRHVFLPGDKLDVQQLADNLGVSRTPVKDAINRLTSEGLVVLQSRRGTYVARLTPDALHDLFDARLMIETWAAARAAGAAGRDCNAGAGVFRAERPDDRVRGRAPL